MANILVIEDDLTFSRILEGFLSKQGFKVRVAHKGAEGMQQFQSKASDLVLLDYRLPDVTGMDVLVDIKKNITLYTGYYHDQLFGHPHGRKGDAGGCL